jgi:hypothetical protein
MKISWEELTAIGDSGSNLADFLRLLAQFNDFHGISDIPSLFFSISQTVFFFNSRRHEDVAEFEIVQK